MAAEPIYRAPMRARNRHDVDPGAGADFGLAHGLVGTGDQLTDRPGTLDEAIAATAREHGAKAARMLERFAALPDGTLVWTRDSADRFALGRIAGPWRYEDSAAMRTVGIHHVRPARWLERDFSVAEVPAAVAATFARGGRNLQRTHDRAAEEQTSALWAEHARPATAASGPAAPSARRGSR